MKKGSCWHNGRRRLTQWGSSWGRKRVPVKTTEDARTAFEGRRPVPVKTTGMQKPQKNCGNLWKKSKALSRSSMEGPSVILSYTLPA